MIVESVCKFCAKPLRLIVDDLYQEDKFKLLLLAACDTCADYRVRRRIIVERLKWICTALACKQITAQEDLERVRKNLKTLLIRFILNQAKYRQVDVPEFDEEMLETLMNNPARLGAVLSLVPGMLRKEATLL